MQIPKPQELYRHFKGNLYQVITIAQHSETGEEMVVYQALYGDYKVYVRPLDMFMSPVDKVKYPDATQEYRFEKIAKLSDEKQTKSPENIQPTDSREAVQTAYLLDPAVEAFFDAHTYEDRLNVLASVRHRITDEMLNMMAMSCDIELPEGDTEKRYSSFQKALQTLQRYECSRLR